MTWIVAIAALIVGLVALGIAIWAVVRAGKAIKHTDDAFSSMRERVGRLVADINAVNELEYNVDVSQQNKINAISSR
jgi:cytosine/uracil/thiamine/allantoin permease